MSEPEAPAPEKPTKKRLRRNGFGKTVRVEVTDTDWYRLTVGEWRRRAVARSSPALTTVPSAFLVSENPADGGGRFPLRWPPPGDRVFQITISRRPSGRRFPARRPPMPSRSNASRGDRNFLRCLSMSPNFSATSMIFSASIGPTRARRRCDRPASQPERRHSGCGPHRSIRPRARLDQIPTEKLRTLPPTPEKIGVFCRSPPSARSCSTCGPAAFTD